MGVLGAPQALGDRRRHLLEAVAERVQAQRVPRRGPALSEAYEPDNLLDRRTPPARLETFYRHAEDREATLLARHLGIPGGDVLSVGAGWHPGRHLFPAPAWRLTAVDLDPARAAQAVAEQEADAGFEGAAGALHEVPDAGFDVVLYRLVLHHIAFSGPLGPCFAEARRLLRPGGALVAIEPGLRHPVGAALAAANARGLGVRVHGTPDDVPLSPAVLRAEAAAAGLAPELHTVTYGWRRLPAGVQRALWPLDALGSLPGLRAAGHTLLLLARR